MSGFKWLLYIFISIFVYFIIYFIFSALYIKYVKKDFIQVWEIFKIFLYKISIMILIIFTIVWWFLYYNNSISPASLQIYKISSDEKEIIFQTMSHIWTKKFYKQVEENIIDAKKKWYVLFYEWVKLEKKEKEMLSDDEKIKRKILWKYSKSFQKQKKLQDDFNKALDIILYKKFSKLCGLVVKNNQQFLWLINNKDFNIDLSLEEILKIYKQKIKNKKQTKKSINLDKVEGINKKILNLLKNVNKKELKVLVWVNRWIMNFIVKNDNFRKKILELSGKQDIMWVILDNRNKYLVKEILNSKHKKIIIIYWMMHFEWVFEELRKADKTWKIDSKEEIFFIK